MEKKELQEMLKGIWESLTDEVREKVAACGSAAELTELLSKAGVELPDEVLDAVSGAGDWQEAHRLFPTGQDILRGNGSGLTILPPTFGGGDDESGDGGKTTVNFI